MLLHGRSRLASRGALTTLLRSVIGSDMARIRKIECSSLTGTAAL